MRYIYKYCNSIRDHRLSPIYGRYLACAENNQLPIVRHFGLQLLENVVKYKWNDGPYDNKEKQQIKQAVIELVEKVFKKNDVFFEKLQKIMI